MWSGKGIWNWLGSFLLLPITEFNFAESWEMGPRMHPSENLLSIAMLKTNEHESCFAFNALDN